jgi:uncharacterized protein YbaR (Trm112 family)
MPASPRPSNSRSSNPLFDLRMLEQLACPVCFAQLRLADSAEQIVCVGCGRAYPLIDGIPVLIADRGVLPA